MLIATPYDEEEKRELLNRLMSDMYYILQASRYAMMERYEDYDRERTKRFQKLLYLAAREYVEQYDLALVATKAARRDKD